MHLDELGVRVDGAVHVRAPVGRAGVDGRVGRAPVDDAGAARGQADRVGGERLDLHVAQVDGDDAPAGALLVLHERQVLPVLELAHPPFGLVAADLFVEGVEELLPGGSAGERGAVVERAAEAAEVEQSLGGAVEGHPHAVEEVDDGGRRVAHALHGRLLDQEVGAADGVVQVDVGVIAFALGVHRPVDAALRADRMAALHRHDGEDVDLLAGLRQLDHRHQPGQAAADDDVALRHCTLRSRAS